MKALILKKQEITGSKEDFKGITETTWYFLGIPIFYSKISIIR